MRDSEDNTLLRPIATPETLKTKTHPKHAPELPKLSLWAQIIGAAMAISSLILTLRGMFRDFPLQGSNHALAEHFSTIMLFGFIGSFGFVPGILLYWWGRTLRRRAYKPLTALLPALFGLPFWGLAIFLLLNGGIAYGIIALFCAVSLSLIALYVWRRQPKNPPT